MPHGDPIGDSTLTTGGDPTRVQGSRTVVQPRGEPEEGTPKRDGDIRVDEFANGFKEGEQGARVRDIRLSKGS